MRREVRAALQCKGRVAYNSVKDNRSGVDRRLAIGNPLYRLFAVRAEVVRMSQVSENLRFLLWLKRVQRSEWAAVLGYWANCDIGRAEELLEGGEPAQHELEHIARAVDYSEDALVRTSLLAAHGIDVLRENILFLTERLGYGRKKDLAAALKIHPTTITKWRSGESHPRESHLEALCRYFGLPASTNIEVEPIFLIVETREQREQRAWVRARIEKLDPETWRLAYPFLKYLLTDFLPIP